jgi:hypothetical protein
MADHLSDLLEKHPWVKVGAWARHTHGILNRGYPMQITAIEKQHNTLLIVLEDHTERINHQIDGFLQTFVEVPRTDPCIGQGLEPFWSLVIAGVHPQ